LDKLASQGILFTRAYVTCPQCSPSRGSILTGRTAHSVGASRLHSYIDEDVPNIIKYLKEKGYYTSAYYRVHQHNIQKNFDQYVPTSEQVWDNVMDMTPFFENRPENKPFFLWFAPALPRHGGQTEISKFKGVNDPLNVVVPDYLPDIPQVRKELADYYNAISFFDAQCGHILKMLDKYKLTENTIIVMAGDNGFDWPRGKASLYESGINVPLIVKWPGVVKPGQKSDALVSLIDLPSTWLEAAGIPIPEKMEGKSLIPLIKGEKYVPNKYIFSERNWHNHWDPMRAVVGERYKLIQNYRPEFPYVHILGYMPSWDTIKVMRDEGRLTGKLLWYEETSKSRPQVEFYDLQNDHGEWDNLAEKPEYKQLVKEYQNVLSDWMNETNDFLPPPEKSFGGSVNYDSKGINTLNGTFSPTPKK